MKSVNIVFPEKRVVRLHEEEISSPSAGKILCVARKSLVSTGTETACLRGEYDRGTYWEEFIQYPFHPGYSMAAEVIEVGPGVAKVKVGDRITTWGEHRQRFVIDERDAFLVPKGISDEEATWSTLARTTQLGVRRANLQLGEVVGVVGLGLLGQLVVQYLRVLGARKILAIDTSESRLNMALSHGATHALNVDIQEAGNLVRDITNGKMLDAVYDVTGHPSVLAPATTLLRKLGRVVLLGDSTMPSLQHLGPRIVGDSISILGIHGMMYPETATVFNPWTAEEMCSLFFDYVLQGRMNVSDLITHRYSPTEAPSVYEWLLRDRSTAMGVIFDWTLI